MGGSTVLIRGIKIMNDGKFDFVGLFHKLQASIHGYVIVDLIRKFIPHAKLHVPKPRESQGPSPLTNMAPMILELSE